MIRNTRIPLADGLGETGTKPVLDPEIRFNGVEDDSHETFWLPATLKEILDIEYVQKDDDGFVFSCTKTAYKPYDTVVTACLTILKNSLGKDIKVESDGEVRDFNEGLELAQQYCHVELDHPLQEMEPKQLELNSVRYVKEK